MEMARAAQHNEILASKERASQKLYQSTIFFVLKKFFGLVKKKKKDQAGHLFGNPKLRKFLAIFHRTVRRPLSVY